jgi:predicted RNA polymerase sigma factor
MQDYLPLAATLAELFRRSGDDARAAAYLTRALELPSTMTEKKFLLRKLQSLRPVG